YESVREAYRGLSKYFKFYNERRLHQSLDYKAPIEIHF
ncbi:MAG: transposase, partial [Candidatus Cloacimonetes bacterium]|nr:transposase [Candidatus Cloacimonadota bacterium]